MLQKLIGLVFLLVATAAAADEDLPYSRLTLVFGPYVYHYHNDPSHNDLPWLTGVEWAPEGSWLDVGAVYFRNSFYQDSGDGYASKRWFIIGEHAKRTYLKLTVGHLRGYRP